MDSEEKRKCYFRLTKFVLIIYGIISIVVLASGMQLDWGVWMVFGASVFGTLITLLLSSQKQALEEMAAFRQLFKEFNDRYHGMNKDLNHIKKCQNDEPLSDDDQNKLYDYFNLCSEEYLYFKREYIYPEVWQAWCNGMLDYLNNDRICKLWREEEQTYSYYGLTYEKILQGSKLNNRLK